MRRTLSFALLLAILVIMGMTMPARHVEAGTNGQQLRLEVYCSSRPAIAEIKVVGFNQRTPPQKVRWSATPNTRGVNTTGYWWVGWVNIEWRYVGSNDWYVTSANVPKTFNRDIYPVAVDWNFGC